MYRVKRKQRALIARLNVLQDVGTLVLVHRNLIHVQSARQHVRMSAEMVAPLHAMTIV